VQNCWNLAGACRSAGDAAPAAHHTCDDFRSGTWRLNVIPDAQGRGVGRFAVESVAAEIRRRDGTQMYLTWEPGEDGPEGSTGNSGFSSPGRRARGRRSGCWI
jgi:diamine N-acetyltransferase